MPRDRMWDVNLCRWPGCSADAVTVIGTTLLGKWALCGEHRAAWLDCTYDEQCALASHFQPRRVTRNVGPGTYAPMRPGDCIGVRGRGGNSVG
jgi:hypothetical protein